MENRNPLDNLPPAEHKVHSGDFFGVIRLDGLDPMLAWGMFLEYILLHGLGYE